MPLNLNEILESGLVELYVLGQLSGDELKEVEDAIIKYPELKSEIFEIEKALYNYDVLHKIDPPAGSLNKILSQINKTPGSESNKGKASGGSKWPFISGLLGLLLLSIIIFFYNDSRNKQELIDQQSQLLEDCDDQKVENQQRQNMYAAALNAESSKVVVAPTEKYPETALVIYNNQNTGKNYLQIDQLPTLAANQSFQLWSLKGDNPPIPLDVFEDDTNDLIEIGFVDETNAYAITIEPRGGSQTPTLENLIGVFSIES